MRDEDQNADAEGDLVHSRSIGNSRAIVILIPKYKIKTTPSTDPRISTKVVMVIASSPRVGGFDRREIFRGHEAARDIASADWLKSQPPGPAGAGRLISCIGYGAQYSLG
jgi:hypothetical protein